MARLTEAGRAGKAGAADVARLRSLMAKGSSLWLRTTPTSPGLVLTDVQWRWAAQLRLGMAVPACAPSIEACDHNRAAAEPQDGWHPLGCVGRPGGAVTERHNAVLRTIAHHARLLHMDPRLEPHSLFKDSNRRHDIH